MRTPFRFIPLALLCSLALNVSAAEPQATEPASGTRVAFAPVDGARFERVLVSQFSNSANDESVNLGEIRTHVNEHWEKSGDQWLLTCVPASTNVQISNNALLARIQKIALSEPYTITFNTAGEIVTVSGFEDLAEKIKAATPEEWHAAIDTEFTPQAQQIRVANSPTYQFNWLYGKGWSEGEQHSKSPTQLMTGGTVLRVTETYTVSAVDAGTLILRIDGSSEVIRKSSLPPANVSARGTATFDTASGLLRQLQTTSTSDSSRLSQDSDPILTRHSEVINITWTKAE